MSRLHIAWCAVVAEQRTDTILACLFVGQMPDDDIADGEALVPTDDALIMRFYVPHRR